jgi:hypothetical protein
MPQPHRRTATRVRGGRVQKKNNWQVSPDDYYARPRDDIRLDRRPPGAGYRHLLTIEDVRSFLRLLPDWDEIGLGLNAVVLDTRLESDVLGWHLPRVVGVCAWERHLWSIGDVFFVASAAPLLKRLDVKFRRLPNYRYELRWTEWQAKAFQLLDVLVHELGHHHDRVTTHGRRGSARGEPYAERYASRVAEAVWPAFTRAFPA